MKIIWTHEALEETRLIYNYYKLTASLRVAKSIKNKIFASVKNYNRIHVKDKLKNYYYTKKENTGILCPVIIKLFLNLLKKKFIY